LIAISSDEDKRNDVNGELAKNRSNDVEVEDIWLRAFLGKALDRLGSGNRQEADTHEHSTDRDLPIAKFDTFEV
jgi:hypothetical protein